MRKSYTSAADHSAVTGRIRYLKVSLFKAALRLSAVAFIAGLSLPTSPAQARVFVSVGVPFYGCCGPYPYYPYPYYAPPPVIYAPPPVIYAPPAPTLVAPQAQTWYYCDNPKGYYPYVSECTGGWRQVPAQPK